MTAYHPASLIFLQGYVIDGAIFSIMLIRSVSYTQAV